MRATAIGVVMAGLILSGCNKNEGAMSGPGAKAPGRYAGIGTFDADVLWKQMTGVTEPKDPAAARLADDSRVIVVIDSHTGEVRQCGNNSGHCVTMNPWEASSAPNAAPINLKIHASDLEAGAENGSETADTATNETAPAPAHQ